MRDHLSLHDIAIRLRDYKREDTFEQDPYRFTLTEEIRNLTLKMDMLIGLFSYDKVIGIYCKGERVPTVMTIEAPFVFAEHEGKILLLVLEKKLEANRIANRLSDIIFIRPGQIVEARIPQDVLRRFHEENPEGTKLIWFNQVDIPGIEKLSLCGPDLADTALYADYLAHGAIWYIVYTSRRYGYIVGVTRNGIVAIFSKVEEDEFVSYIIDEIFPLVE
jgi:hypothetical protein